MEAVIHSFFVILLANVCTAGFQGPQAIQGPLECEQTCGTTSCVSEILGKLLKTYNPVLVAGLRNDFYGIYGVNYDYQPCQQVVANLHLLSAYVFEVPASKTRSYALFAIVIATGLKCPYVFELKCDTPGYVPQLTIEWKTVYEVIILNKNYMQPTPCNLVDAVSHSAFFPTTYPGEVDITLDMGDITSFQQVQMNAQNNQAPSYSCINKGDYQCVEEVPYNTFVEKVFYEYYRVNKTCPIPYVGAGKILSDQNYDFSIFLDPRGGCRLATEYEVVNAMNPSSSPLAFSILSFVPPQAKFFFRLTVLVTTNVRFGTFLELHKVCGRTNCPNANGWQYPMVPEVGP